MKKPEDEEDHNNGSQPKLPDLNLPAQTSESPQTMSGTPAQRLACRDRIKKYLTLVKDTLQDRMEIYYEFLNLTNYIGTERFGVSYVMGRMKELFKEHPQLILEYNSFVHKEFQIPLPPEDAPKLAKQLNLNDGDNRKIQETRHERDHWDKNVQQKRNYVPMKECAAQRFYQGAEDIESAESDVYYRGTIKSRQEVVDQNMYSRYDDMEKSIEELDLSTCKNCTPSYRILPENYTLPSVSQRTDIGTEVLNDHCVLVTSGSEDFKNKPKNQYENTIFKCEDNRFELDMWLELVHSTIARIQELLDKISNNDINTDHPFRIEDYLTAPYLMCIKRLYGEYWVDVMDEIRKNAPLPLSVILSRLKQKQVEWKNFQSTYNKEWAKTLSKNFDKSLDHRSCKFKQQDSKSLSNKALVSEIKEISEKQQLEDAAVESIVARSRQPRIPHMEFEFPDPEIHEDLYHFIKYCCGEICPRQADNLMKIWTTFLEPVLGVPRRPQGAGDTSSNSTCESVGENDLGSCGSASTNQKQSDVSGNGYDFTVQSLAASQLRLDDGITVDNDDPTRSIDLMGDVCTKAIPSSNQKLPLGTRSLHNRSELSVTHLEVERKEGNLSPYRDDELKKFSVCSGGSIDASSSTEDYSSNRPLGYGEGMVGDAGEHVADNDYVECALGISQKASQSVDVSGSDSADFSFKESDSEENEDQMSAGPLNEIVPLALHEEDKNGLIFYGNASFYVLFRLHQTLYERIRKAKLYCSSAENRFMRSNDTKPTDLYERLVNAIYHFLGGSCDNAEFENHCRSIIGIHSYHLCTLDKLIHRVVKQLRKIARDEADMRFIQLHAYEESRNPAHFTDVIYSANAHFMLPNDNIYRMERASRGSRLTIQLMDYRNYELIRSMIYTHDKPENITNFEYNQFTAYLNNDLLSVVPEETETHGIYLKRNKRKNARGDESDAQDEAFEGVVILNALEIKISPLTSKASYFMHTEDFMYRTKKRRAIFYRSISSNTHSANGISVKKLRCRLLAGA